MNKNSFSNEVESFYFREDVSVLEALSYIAGKHGIEMPDIKKFVNKKLESMLYAECIKKHLLKPEEGKGKWRMPVCIKH